jgi:hypothetical protein
MAELPKGAQASADRIGEQVTPAFAKALAAKLRGLVEPIVGPENPPVNAPLNAMAELLKRGDPMGAMGLAMPLVRYDMWGKPIKVAAETGKPLAKTAKDFARMKAEAELATRLGRGEGTDQAFRGVALRHSSTGEVMEGGRYHPDLWEKLGPGQHPDWEDGFVTKDGHFLTRKEATKFIPSEQMEFSGAPAGSDDIWPWRPTRKE